MNLTLIAAIGKNNELGLNNNLIWKIPEDMRFFKENTTGKIIVMGRKTFESLKAPLPNRRHIVLTRKNINLGPNILTFQNIIALFNYLQTINEEIMVIGGALIYKELIEYANKLLITKIDKSSESDAYFPEIDRTWTSETLGEYTYKNLTYKRLKYTKKGL